MIDDLAVLETNRTHFISSLAASDLIAAVFRSPLLALRGLL